MNEPTGCPIRDENGRAPLEHSCCRELAALRAWKERWEPVIEAANRMRNAIEDSAWRGRFRYQVLVFDRAVRTARALEEAGDE